ncbi:MAG: rhodanese-like domain-containing protein [Limisphaerales bacterium]
MTPKELADLLRSPNPPLLLDVRQPEEFALAALPGAKLIPLNELPERVGELAAWSGREVVVYCHHGMRSAHAIGWLRRQGFTQLHNLAGGIDRWSQDVDPNLPRY